MLIVNGVDQRVLPCPLTEVPQDRISASNMRDPYVQSMGAVT